LIVFVLFSQQILFVSAQICVVQGFAFPQGILFVLLHYFVFRETRSGFAHRKDLHIGFGRWSAKWVHLVSSRAQFQIPQRLVLRESVASSVGLVGRESVDLLVPGELLNLGLANVLLRALEAKLFELVGLRVICERRQLLMTLADRVD
jgi:hypothetical protein